MKFKGYDGEIELDGNVIKIKKGKKDVGRTIPLSQVTSTTLKKPVLTAAGCIHIQVLDARTYPNGTIAPNYAADVNAIFFRKPQYEEALKFKEVLDKAIENLSSPAQTVSPDLSLLKNLKELLVAGILTQEEFDKKKSQILGL